MFEKLRDRWLGRLSRAPVELEPKDGYALWSADYPPRPHNPLMELEQKEVLGLLPDVTGQTVLDLACGSGRYMTTLMERGASRSVGLDLTAQMLAQVQNHREYLVQGDLRQLPLANASFNVVVCGLAVGHVDDLAGVIAEIGRVLTPGGVAVYSDLHPFGALAGWKRTFRGHDGRLYAVRHNLHLYSEHHTACRAAGLVIEDVREPAIDFEHVWRGCPAVLVFRVRKATD